jgi:hypothetical protein
MSAHDAKETLLQRCPAQLHPYIEALDRNRRYAWQKYFEMERAYDALLEKLKTTQKK